MGNMELFEHVGRVTQGLPVRLASHDDADQRRTVVFFEGSLRGLVSQLKVSIVSGIDREKLLGLFVAPRENTTFGKVEQSMQSQLSRIHGSENRRVTFQDVNLLNYTVTCPFIHRFAHADSMQYGFRTGRA